MCHTRLVGSAQDRAPAAVGLAAAAVIVLVLGGLIVLGVLAGPSDTGTAQSSAPRSSPTTIGGRPSVTTNQPGPGGGTVGRPATSADETLVPLPGRPFDAPLATDAAVIALLPDQLLAIDRTGLTELWRVPCHVGRWADPTPSPEHRTVLVWCDQELTAVDSDTGDVRWRSDRWGATFAPIDVGADIALLTIGDTMSVIDLSTGDVAWDMTAPPAQVPPMTVGDAVIVTDDRSIVAYDAVSGRSRWAHEVQPTSALDVDGELYAMIDTSLVVYDPADGAEVRRIDLANPPVGGPQLVSSGGDLVILSDWFRTSTAAIGRTDGVTRWVRPDAAAKTAPGFRGALVVRLDTEAISALDPQTGEVRATFGTDGCSADEDEVFCGVQQGDDGALAIWRLP